MCCHIIALCLALYALMVCGNPIDSMIPGDKVVEMSWEVEPYPGGPPVILNGTVQKVYARLIEINPSYDDDWKASRPEPELHARSPTQDVSCKAPWDAGLDAIKSGIRYLRKVQGRPRLDGGTCSRVSCSYNSAITWCNDSKGQKILPSFNNIADGAQVIVNKCTRRTPNAVQGTLGHTDEWRVIVNRAIC
ncbi:hypothetical protein BJX76DRAFT_364703 [Aspergillus varians]